MSLMAMRHTNTSQRKSLTGYKRHIAFENKEISPPNGQGHGGSQH